MLHKYKIFLELRREVKVTVIQIECVTLLNPKMYPHNKCGIPTSNNIEEYALITFFLELWPEVKVTVTPRHPNLGFLPQII